MTDLEKAAALLREHARRAYKQAQDPPVMSERPWTFSRMYSMFPSEYWLSMGETYTSAAMILEERAWEE